MRLMHAFAVVAALLIGLAPAMAQGPNIQPRGGNPPPPSGDPAPEPSGDDDLQLRFKRYIIGEWRLETPIRGRGGVSVSEIQYEASGEFSGKSYQASASGQRTGQVRTVKGLWAVEPIDQRRFILRGRGQGFSAMNRMEVLDEDRVLNETEGGIARRISR